VKVNGKQKGKSLKTSLFSVAKLKLADFEAHVRAKGATEIAATASTAGTETSMAPSPPAAQPVRRPRASSPHLFAGGSARRPALSSHHRNV